MFALLLISVVSSQTPQPPLWPNVFWQNFTEATSYPNVSLHHTEGAYYYNYSMQAYKISRNNGRFDNFCSMSGPYNNMDTPCDQIVVGGNRYLYYPAHTQCCYCCNSTSGCGILFPGWLQDAQYVDTEVHDGVLTYKWFKQGGQKNYIWETVAKAPLDRVTIAIDQLGDGNNDYLAYGERRDNTFPATVLSLPSICSLSNLCTWGACQDIRNRSTKIEENAYV